MGYRVQFMPAADRQLAKLEAGVQRRIVAAADALGLHPRPPGCKRLKGRLRDMYRIRVGAYRVIYAIRDAELLVLVVKVGDRRDVYE